MSKNFLRVSLRKDFGVAGELSIELEANEPVDPDKGLIEFDLVVDQINKMFDHYMTHHATKIRAGGLAQDKVTERFAAESISVIMKDGKRLYRVKGGQYSEHGVPFYPEHMKLCGIDPANVPDEGYKFKKEVDAIIEMVGGKPKRVLEIVVRG